MNTPLYSGVIINYVCTAACKHCIVASSPDCPKDHITEEAAERIARLLRESGAYSVHIGGGEPFINFSSLCTAIRALTRNGIEIDYIETNGFWCSDEKIVRERLNKLKELGVTTIMVSADPFHIEYVPLYRPLLLCKLLRECGFDFFVWKDRYLRSLSKLDITKSYSEEELKEELGEDYIASTAAEYGVGMNGRALSIADSIYPRRHYEEFISSSPCSRLLLPHHCHIDLYGNGLPDGCPGLAMEMRDYLNEALDDGKYPVFTALVKGGTEALYSYAEEKGFVPREEGYPTRCSFCYAMRRYLASLDNPSRDLAPLSFYHSMDKENI